MSLSKESEKDLAWELAWEHPFFAKGPDIWLKEVKRTNVAAAFGMKGGILMCIDEGVEPEPGKNGVYLAGSGILYRKNSIADPQDRRRQLAEDLRDKKITGVMSHSDCGACAIFCHETGSDEPDIVAREWALQLADDLHVPYMGHIERPNRPAFHHALIAYYDGTASLRDPSLGGLPPGFTISRGIIDDTEHALYELNLACQIAFGDHGFGDRFTAERPFHIVVIVDTTDTQLTEDKLVSEVRPVLEKDSRLKLVVMHKPTDESQNSKH
ncbi:MAG: hypothetical protein JWM56_881 [Candidatus Peribacteria bacterium]|nr:hypothetical protein [Candidatus Peribacteria bacterium]